MLKYVIVKYSLKKKPDESQTSESTCVSLLVEYKNHLVAGGYLCRKKSSIYEDREHQRIYLSGILGSPSALRDAEKEPKIAEFLRNVQGYLERDVEVKEFGICRESWYCEDHEWKSLLLINSRLFGEPSFVCTSCGDLVATYRLKLPLNLANEVWSLEREADAINDLTVICGCYEDWSDSQIENVDSALNKYGQTVAKAIGRHLGIDVFYALETGEKTYEVCPNCGVSLKKLEESKTYKICESCSIAVM